MIFFFTSSEIETLKEALGVTKETEKKSETLHSKDIISEKVDPKIEDLKLKPTPQVLNSPENIDIDDKSLYLFFWMGVIVSVFVLLYRIISEKNITTGKLVENLNNKNNSIRTIRLKIDLPDEFKKKFTRDDPKEKKAKEDEKEMIQREKSTNVFNKSQYRLIGGLKENIKKELTEDSLKTEEKLKILSEKSAIELSEKENNEIYNDNFIFKQLEKEFDFLPNLAKKKNFDLEKEKKKFDSGQKNRYEHFCIMQILENRKQFNDKKFEQYDISKAKDITLEDFFKRKINEQKNRTKVVFDEKFKTLKKEYESEYIKTKSNGEELFMETSGSDFIKNKVESLNLPFVDKNNIISESCELFDGFYSNFNSSKTEETFTNFDKILKKYLIPVEKNYDQICAFGEKEYRELLKNPSNNKYIEKDKYIEEIILKNLLNKNAHQIFLEISEKWKFEWEKDKKENAKEFYNRIREEKLKLENPIVKEKPSEITEEELEKLKKLKKEKGEKDKNFVEIYKNSLIKIESFNNEKYIASEYRFEIYKKERLEFIKNFTADVKDDGADDLQKYKEFVMLENDFEEYEKEFNLDFTKDINLESLESFKKTNIFNFKNNKHKLNEIELKKECLEFEKKKHIYTEFLNKPDKLKEDRFAIFTKKRPKLLNKRELLDENFKKTEDDNFKIFREFLEFEWKYFAYKYSCEKDNNKYFIYTLFEFEDWRSTRKALENLKFVGPLILMENEKEEKTEHAYFRDFLMNYELFGLNSYIKLRFQISSLPAKYNDMQSGILGEFLKFKNEFKFKYVEYLKQRKIMIKEITKQEKDCQIHDVDLYGEFLEFLIQHENDKKISKENPINYQEAEKNKYHKNKLKEFLKKKIIKNQ